MVIRVVSPIFQTMFHWWKSLLLELLLQSFKPYSTYENHWEISFISLNFMRYLLIRSRSKFYSLLEISSIEVFTPLISTSPSLLEITYIKPFEPFNSPLKSLVRYGDVMLRFLVSSENLLEFSVCLIDIENYKGFLCLLKLMKVECKFTRGFSIFHF